MKLNKKQLHQLWYSSNEHGLIGLPFDDDVDKYVKKLLAGDVQMLSYKDGM
jgi:hypothetical protein